jgi:hypothetical protein
VSNKVELAKSAGHEVDHSNEDEGVFAVGGAVVAFGESSPAIPPAEGPFDDPAFRKNLEAAARPTDQFHAPAPQNPSPISGGLVRSVGPEDFGKLDPFAEPFQHEFAAVAILHRGWRDDQRPQQAERVNDDVSLASDDLFFPRRSLSARLARSL